MSDWRTDRSYNEDRNPWYKLGNDYERQFCDTVAPSIGLEAVINPEKANNPKVPDLIVNGWLSELKVRTSPFYTAREKFGIDPQYCFMINCKDLDYYNRCYPDLLIYFWVKYANSCVTLGNRVYSIQSMNGIWCASVREINKATNRGIFGKLSWGSGRDSYALNLGDFLCIHYSN